ncbi:MAG: Glutathione transport system permease protein GsiC [Alphaproteobacteria bacterium MarineAlpha5_Bin5]|mgnify:FL=1|nr:MAG: Glutathione transport system permease protein GsiC [Alphaproteobacteria bacterium MarineAlpha5_Bin4]PPR51086.1 MAG: Glutathione transport system permease protein GsiC [Alphaproteobacteria bacterium MarineAlpha5_Bin5]
MTNYFLKRLIQSVLVMLVVAFVSFSLFNFVGDPVHNMVGQEASTEKRQEIREKLGLNDPVYIQFLRFVRNASVGEFGISYQLRRPVAELISERLPATLELVFISALIAIVSGVAFGVYTGINRDGFLSNVILILSLFGVSLPTFVIGILFIYLFSVILGILPSFGRGEVVDIGFWSTGFLTLSGIKAIILPSITLSLFQMTYIIRLVRAEIMEILQTDYIKFARARGIKKNIINFKHALKNGLIPVITITGINVGTLIAFSIITETVFQWPGMGFLFINAVHFVDIPIMSAYLIMVAFIFVMINFIVDIAYYFIDPRIRIKEETSSE